MRSVEMEVHGSVRSKFDEPHPLVQAVISLFTMPHSRNSVMSINKVIDVMFTAVSVIGPEVVTSLIPTLFRFRLSFAIVMFIDTVIDVM